MTKKESNLRAVGNEDAFDEDGNGFFAVNLVDATGDCGGDNVDVACGEVCCCAVDDEGSLFC